MTDLKTLASKAKQASLKLGTTDTLQKNQALKEIANALLDNTSYILENNQIDLENAQNNNTSEAMLDRLMLDDSRIKDIANGLIELINLEDPIGKELSTTTRPNGLKIVKQSVPLGVVAIIYEARPNVTVDAAGLCLKSGNVCILRGGKEAINSNLALTKVIREAIVKVGLPEDCVCFVNDTSRDAVNELMSLNNYIDVVIPRGGAGLIRAVCSQSKIPVIKTGEGVCHIYIDDEANLQMAKEIVYNAKCSRPSVCNAVECVLINKKIAKKFLSIVVPDLKNENVEFRCDDYSLSLIDGAVNASDDDWDAEYNDYILAIKTVDDINEAIDFINIHGTEHSEAIITNNNDKAQQFLKHVDASSVYVNASTRFTDGGEFGLGAEIGISTQKIHARGPMGLNQMTSYKYLIYGNGQVR